MDIFSWSDGVKGNLNQALVSLCLVLCMLVVFISCCLGFISCHIVVVAFGFASVSQVIGWEDRLRTCIIIIIIIFIIEKINVAFSRRTARTRNSHKKTKAAKTSCLTVRKKKKM